MKKVLSEKAPYTPELKNLLNSEFWKDWVKEMGKGAKKSYPTSAIEQILDDYTSDPGLSAKLEARIRKLFDAATKNT